jgi:hypothetical protein
MTRLFVHAGPYKTGTTSVQEHFWHHRQAHLADHGLLYPQTGIVADAWGHRHARLAPPVDTALWDALLAEMQATGPDRVLLSAERMSRNLGGLAPLRDRLAPLAPVLILTLRDEADLVRSMYLQLARGAAMSGRANGASEGFAGWWQGARGQFVYGRMIDGWCGVFGRGTFRLIVSRRDRPVDAVTAICGLVDVPVLDRLAQANPSIGALSARVARAATPFGRVAARGAMAVAGQIERLAPGLADRPLPGFDAAEIRAWYAEANAPWLDRYPRLHAAYTALHG